MTDSYCFFFFSFFLNDTRPQLYSTSLARIGLLWSRWEGVKVCLRSAFTLLTRDPFQNTQWLLFPLENCSLQTYVAIIPPSSCSLNHVVITRLPLTSLLASSSSLPPSLHHLSASRPVSSQAFWPPVWQDVSY